MKEILSKGKRLHVLKGGREPTPEKGQCEGQNTALPCSDLGEMPERRLRLKEWSKPVLGRAEGYGRLKSVDGES